MFLNPKEKQCVGLQLSQEWSPAEGSSEQPAEVLLLKWILTPKRAMNMKTMDCITFLVRL